MPKTELITWLMDASTPSIRYRTLVDLLGLPADEPRVVQARREIMETGAVPAILSQQTEKGSWSGERGYYTPKYTSTHWSLLLLAELDVDGGDPRYQLGVRHMFSETAAELEQRIKDRATGGSCFWGNLLRYALRSEVRDEARIDKIVSYVATDLQRGSCVCSHNGRKACAWGVVRGLWSMAALPKERRNPEINAAIECGVKFLLDSYRLADANYPTGGQEEKINPLWFKLNFPLFYQADILFTLRVLDELNMLHQPGAQTALDWLEQRRGKNGRWAGGNPYRGRTWKELGDRQETNRWVSLYACRILMHAGEFHH